MENKKNIALFELYLAGGMSDKESQDFESRLEDSDFKNEFEEYQTFIKAIEETVEYKETRIKLDTIHNDLFKRKKALYLRPSFYVVLSVAACLLFFVIIDPNLKGDESYAENMEMAEQNPEGERYEESDLHSMAIETDDFIENGNNQVRDTLLRSIDQEPIGNAFLISNEGYFLSSKHIVESRDIVFLQNKDSNLTFEAHVVYKDSNFDFAILKCSKNISKIIGRVPYKFSKNQVEINEEVFMLGYSKKNIDYTSGRISSENDFNSDSPFMKLTISSSPAFEGAPLFNNKGKVVGIIMVENFENEPKAYALKYSSFLKVIYDLESEGIKMNLSKIKSRKFKNQTKMIRRFRPFIFEVH